MFVCPYCGDSSTELVTCCGERHGEELTSDEFEIFENFPDLTIEEIREKAALENVV